MCAAHVKAHTRGYATRGLEFGVSFASHSSCTSKMATVHRQKLHVVVSCVLSSHARGKILSAREAMFPVPSKP